EESGPASVWQPIRDLIVRAWSEFRAAPEGFTDIAGSACAVPLATVLNDEVDLTPKRYLRMPPPGGASRDELAARLAAMDRRVATRKYVGAYSTATVFLIRVDQAIIDPWFLAAYLSSSDGEYQATHMNSPAGERTRFDPRRVRIPLLPIATQQHYGRMFRAIA